MQRAQRMLRGGTAEARPDERRELLLELLGGDGVLGVASRIVAGTALGGPAGCSFAFGFGFGETGYCQADGPRRRILCAEIILHDHADASKKLRDGRFPNAVGPESIDS